MSNKPVLITGCQRSGTTLLNLILDSHPMIRGIDEAEYDNARMNEYLQDSAYYPYVVFKLPMASHFVSGFNRIPGLRVLWCVRDPRDVVLSMLKLKMKFRSPDLENVSWVSWANHPVGAALEIENCLASLANTVDSELLDAIKKYREINKKPPLLRSVEEAVFTAALCWRLKNQLLDLYQKENILYKVLRYEDLITNPKLAINEVLSYLELPWNDDVLRHHELHSGTSIGSTENVRPIDSKNMCKWEGVLSNNELSLIQSVCSKVAKNFDYQLSIG